MISVLDIWRAAKLLVDQHGADAPIKAAQRADEMLAAASRAGPSGCRHLLPWSAILGSTGARV